MIVGIESSKLEPCLETFDSMAGRTEPCHVLRSFESWAGSRGKVKVSSSLGEAKGIVRLRSND